MTTFIFAGGFRSRAAIAAVLFLILLLPGCASLLTGQMIEPLERSLAGQKDLDLLHDGTPSLLLLLDGLVEASPADKKILTSAIRAHAGFAMLLEEEGNASRAVRHADQARDLALKLANADGRLAGLDTITSDRLAAALASCTTADAPFLYWTAFGLLTSLRYRPDLAQNLAMLPRAGKLMQRVITLDETYENGGAHLFFGYYYGARPVILGGNPETSQMHFERALEISNRKYLPALVLYAESYAAQNFDAELYAKLLQEAISSDERDDGQLGAVNALARKRAARLLAAMSEKF